MIVCDDREFLFVHVQKTGGSSIREILWRYADWTGRPANKLLTRLGLQRDFRRHHYGRHAPFREACGVVPADRLAAYLKFGFVRNPWDRLVSFYSYIMARPDHHRHRRVSRLGSFEAYVDYEIRRGKISQADMLADRAGEQAMDFVGRFERLEADFEEVKARLGLEGDLTWMNRSEHEPFQHYYTPELAERVERAWPEDVAFGYTFT